MRSSRRSFVLKHLALQRRDILRAAGVLALQALLAVALPYPLRFILDEVLVPGRTSAAPFLARVVHGLPAPRLLAGAAACLGLGYALNVLLGYAEVVWTQRAVNAFIQSAREDLAAICLARQSRLGAGLRGADVVSRFSQDTAGLEMLVAAGLPVAVRAVPSLLMILGMVLMTDWRIALALAALMTAMYALIVRFSNRVRAHQKSVRGEVTRFESLTLQAFQDLSRVRSPGLETSLRAQLDASAGRVSDHLLEVSRAEGRLYATTDGAKAAMRFLIVAAGGLAVLRGRLTVGVVVMLLSYVDVAAGTIKDVTKFATKAARAFASVERIEELLAEAGADAEPASAGALAALTLGAAR